MTTVHRTTDCLPAPSDRGRGAARELHRAAGRAARRAPPRPRSSGKAAGGTPMAIPVAVLLLASWLSGAFATAAFARAPPAAVAPGATVTDTIARTTASEELQRAALAPSRAGRTVARPGAARSSRSRRNSMPWRWARCRRPNRSIRSTSIASSGRCSAPPRTSVDDLGTIVRRIEHDGNALESDAREWRERLLFLENQNVPAPVARARAIDRSSGAAHEFPRPGVPRHGAARAATARWFCRRASTARARVIAAQQQRVRSQRTELEQSPLWHLGVDRRPVRARRRRAARRLARAAGLRWRAKAPCLAGCSGRPGECPPGSSPRRSGADARSVAARLRAAGGGVAAHRADVAVVALARPAGPVLRGAADAGADSRGDGDPAGAGGADTVDALRSRVRHDAASAARRGRRERDRQPRAAAAAGDEHCRAGRHRPAPRAAAAGMAVGEPGRRCASSRCWSSSPRR